MSMAQSAIAYVDGFNLYNGIHDAYRHRYLWLDLVRLLERLRPTTELIRVKYFTSALIDEPDAQGRHAEYISALEAAYPGRIEVIRGRYQRKAMVCRTCGATWRSYEEKETDVNIAVALVADALAGEAENLYIVSADSDLVPAIKLIQSQRPDLFSIAFFPPKRKSEELLKLMPSSFVIGQQRLREAQLPDVVDGPTATHSRPAKWKPAMFEDQQPVDVATLSIPVPKPGHHLPKRR
ncbi:NYN domain-containing protein [Herbiconiux sp. P18]|uniref:NYN domain-containing protein n=1 Tax=Herbiconiux liangxiaofengii TaxID=3342795 RepID=UPI0035B79BBF